VRNLSSLFHFPVRVPFSSARARLSLYPRAVNAPRSKGRRSFARDAILSRRGSTRSATRRVDLLAETGKILPLEDARAEPRRRTLPCNPDYFRLLPRPRGRRALLGDLVDSCAHAHQRARARARASRRRAPLSNFASKIF